VQYWLNYYFLTGVPLFNALVLSNLCEYRHKLSLLAKKLHSLGRIFVADSMGLVLTNLT